MGFTFYADLLGISGYYRLSPKRAYNRLNDFYNTTFPCLSEYCRRNRDSVHVNMFSDSLLVWGDDQNEILRQLLKLYLRLMRIGLLLRGALVGGKLRLDPRLTLDNFEKFLAGNDSLARAAGLEATQKGARFLIENSLAEEILGNCDDWLTQEGYLQNIRPNISLDDMKRRICPTPDNKGYELLYLWIPRDSVQNSVHFSEQILRQLTELSSLYSDEISVHYKETLSLLKRCQKRKEYTEREIDPSFNAEINRRVDMINSANNSFE